MAGRNLFAEEAAPKGRNLFADAPVAPAPVATPPPQGTGAQIFDAIGEMFTGNKRATELTDSLPELSQANGLLAGEDQATALRIAPTLLTTTDPDEIAKIITENFPNVGQTFNKDGEGNVFPVLVNNQTGAATVINRPGLSGFDVMQGLGMASLFAPATRAASVAGTAIAGGATSAAMQGAQAAEGGEFNPLDVAVDTVLGAGGKSLENLGGVGARLATGSADSELVDAGTAAGIPILTTDALPPRTFAQRNLQSLSEKVPVAGTGPVRLKQQEARQAAVDKFTEDYGVFDDAVIVRSLKENSDRVKRAAGAVLQSAEQKIQGEVRADRTVGAVITAFEELNKKGVISTDSKTVQDLRELFATLQTPQTFSTLKENRTLFREITEAVDPAGRSQLPSNAKRLFSEINARMTADLTNAARQNLTPKEFAKWRKANAVYANEAKTLTRTRIKNVLDVGDVTPEKVNNLLFSRNRSDLELLHRSLTPEGRRNARASIISSIAEKLNARRDGLTPDTFTNAVKANQKQIDVFFRGSERRRLDGLMKALDATRRAQQAEASPPTGQTVLGALGLAGLVTDPTSTLVTGATLGGIARVLESPVVRDGLITLGSVPRGSTRFEQALRQVQTALTSASQATISER